MFEREQKLRQIAWQKVKKYILIPFPCPPLAQTLHYFMLAIRTTNESGNPRKRKDRDIFGT